MKRNLHARAGRWIGRRWTRWLGTLCGVLLALAVAAGGCKDKGRGVSAPQAESEALTAVARLHRAAREGDVEQVRSLIAGGCEVDARDEDGLTALHVAAGRGQGEVVALLIAEGADVNAKTAGGFHVLSAANDARIAEMLIAAGADVGTQLYNLTWRDYGQLKELAEVLLAHGAQIIPGDTHQNEELLFFAVRNGLHGLMEMLLEGGANANATVNYGSGLNLLTEAVNRGDAEAVRLLIEAGAEVNAPSRHGIGRTALCYAHDAHTDVTELLLAHGADVNLYSPLRWAVAGGHKETVALLLAHGADVNARDAEGETVLDEALARGKTEIAALLREHAQKEQTEKP